MYIGVFYRNYTETIMAVSVFVRQSLALSGVMVNSLGFSYGLELNIYSILIVDIISSSLL